MLVFDEQLEKAGESRVRSARRHAAYFPNPGPGAAWKDASRHLVRSMRGSSCDLQLTRGLISWSGSTIACTWIVSMSSALSQKIRESRTFRISASCSRVKEDGQPEFSYQKRSPARKWLNWRPIMQAKVGPTIAPKCYTGLNKLAKLQKLITVLFTHFYLSLKEVNPKTRFSSCLFSSKALFVICLAHGLKYAQDFESGWKRRKVAIFLKIFFFVNFLKFAKLIVQKSI